MKKNNINRYKTEVGIRLRQARVAACLSQNQVADKLNMHRPTVSKIESGETSVSADRLIQFSILYNVNILWLLSQENKQEITASEKTMEWVQAAYIPNSPIYYVLDPRGGDNAILRIEYVFSNKASKPWMIEVLGQTTISEITEYDRVEDVKKQAQELFVNTFKQFGQYVLFGGVALGSGKK